MVSIQNKFKSIADKAIEHAPKFVAVASFAAVLKLAQVAAVFFAKIVLQAALLYSVNTLIHEGLRRYTNQTEYSREIITSISTGVIATAVHAPFAALISVLIFKENIEPHWDRIAQKIQDLSHSVWNRFSDLEVAE